MLQVRCKNINITRSFPEGISLLDVYQALADEIKLPYPVVAAKVNNAAQGLKFRLFQNRDVEFLDAREGAGHRVYVRSLCFVLYKATSDLFPGSKLFIEHPISRGYYCNFKKRGNEPLTEQDVERIRERMQEIIHLDMPFRRSEATTEEAIRVFKERGFSDKVKLLETSGQIYSDYYMLGDTVDYYYGPLVPSAGYLTVWGLELMHEGMLLRVPNHHNPTLLAEKLDQPNTFEVFAEKVRWDIIMRLSNAGDVNKAVLKGHASELIQVSEALQEKKIVKIAEEIDRRFHAETDPVRIVRMEEDRQLTANFSAVDYIVGWDFYFDQPNQERAADYKSDTENAGILSLHNAEGQTSSWLTRGINNGAENGRWAARIWKPRSQGLYFEISFSAKGYSNLKVASALGVGYNTYSVNHVEYSIDGQNYTRIGTFNLTGNGWFDNEFQLPAEADDKDRVYIRWMPDRTAPLVGNDTDYDGLAITDIFVTADASALADETATLVSSNPSEGATGVSANGSIILTFDKKIVAGEGTARLNGEELSPIISGKTAVFSYSGLQYATAYDFVMPEGVLTSRSGRPVAATTISFTTMERSQPAPRLYDAVVAQDGSGHYATIQEAIDAAPAERATPWLIFIKNGRYQEHVDIPARKPYLHLIGQDRDKTVICDSRLSGGDNAVHVSVGATVVVNANNTFIENLTMENSWGHEKQAGPQALALNTVGDRIAMNHVRLLSYQDTWITTSTSNNRHYIRHSLIEGAVDFIYNSGNVFLDGDTLEINRPSGGYIVAPSHAADVRWGYVFQNSIIRPLKGMNVTDVWLGRPWKNSPKTVYINTQTFVNIPAKGWYETMGGLPVLWADYNTVDADGNPVDLSQRRDTYYYVNDNGERVYGTAKNYLTDEEAAQYTIKNVVGGNDSWQPDLMCEACEAPQPEMKDGVISWQPVPFAICYVVTCDDEVVGFTTQTSYPVAAEGVYQVQAVNEYGGLSLKATADDGTGVDNNVLRLPTPVTAIYGADGTRRSQLTPGLNIVRQQNGAVEKVFRK